MELYPTPYETIAAKGRKIYKWNSAAACVVNYDHKADNVTYYAIGNAIDAIKKKCCVNNAPSCPGGIFHFTGELANKVRMYLTTTSNTKVCPTPKK
jgi:hypothetical protein